MKTSHWPKVIAAPSRQAAYLRITARFCSRCVIGFWYYEPKASTQLLTTFYATSQVDTSRYTPNKVSFTTPSTQAGIAKDLLAAMIGFAVLAALSLLWVARRVRQHGAGGRKTSVATRTIVPLVLGLGGWLRQSRPDRREPLPRTVRARP